MERDPYVHTWMISCHVVVVVEKQVSARCCCCLVVRHFCKLNFGKHYESQYTIPYHTKPAPALATYQNWGKIGIKFWSVLTYRIFTAQWRRREESVRITKNPRFICIRKCITPLTKSGSACLQFQL